jgi:RNA recognition motif-containing protein
VVRIDNLPKQATKEHIEKLIKKYSPDSANVVLVKDKTSGESTGTAYVNSISHDVLVCLIKLHNKVNIYLYLIMLEIGKNLFKSFLDGLYL